jgi:hypothetical protein
MSVDSAVETMLATVLGTDATLTTLAPGGVWRDIAPQGVVGTIVVFSFVSAPDDYTLKVRAKTDYTWLIKALAPGESSAPAQAAADRIDVLLNDTTPKLTDGRILNMRRDRRTSMSEALGGETYQHVGGYYLIQVSENS